MVYPSVAPEELRRVYPPPITDGHNPPQADPYEKKMMITREKPINKKAVERFRVKADRVIEGVMREGFYGTVNLELVLADGIIKNIHTSIEELEQIEK